LFGALPVGGGNAPRVAGNATNSRRQITAKTAVFYLSTGESWLDEFPPVKDFLRFFERFSKLIRIPYKANCFSDESMNHRLHHIQMQDWPELAQKASWCAATLAKQHGVSMQTLRRFFQKEMGKNPKKWLAEQRLLKSNKQIQAGSSVKEAAARLDYKHPSHLSNSFKSHFGCCPTDKTPPIRAQNP
jgi:AraC-like DNA-binding protein